MVRNKNKYGMLSCISKSWLFKIESVDKGRRGDLYISRLFKQDEFLMQLFNLYNLAKDDPDPNVHIPPLEADLPASGSGASGQSGSKNNNQGQGGPSQRGTQRKESEPGPSGSSSTQNQVSRLKVIIHFLKQN